MEPHFKKMGKIIIQDHKRYKIMIPLIDEYPALEEEDFATKLTQFKDKFRSSSNKTKLSKRNNIMTFLDFILITTMNLMRKSSINKKNYRQFL
jgi:hypothetical protein